MRAMCRRAFLKMSASLAPLALWGGAQTRKKIAVIKGDECIACEACVDVCPVNAISIDDKEGVAKVDKKLCDACGDCVEECPVEAIEIKEVDREPEAGAVGPPGKKERLPQLDTGGTAAAAAFDITGLWTFRVNFEGDEKPITALVRFIGTPDRGELSDGETGEKQGAYTVKDGRVEFVFLGGDAAKGKFVSADRMEGTLPQRASWTAERKRRD